MPISSSAPRPLGAAYVPILLSEVEQEQKPSGNRDREAIVVGAGLCNREGERTYTIYEPPILFLIIFAKVYIIDLILATEKLSPFNFDLVPCRPFLA